MIEPIVAGIAAGTLLFLAWVAYENMRDDRRNRKQK